jgi:phage terminase large subunit-like protein
MTKPALTKSKLKNLSQEELFELATRLKNVNDAKQQNRLKAYLDTAHQKQLDFHNNTARVRLFLGGNRSGKTTAGTVEMLWRLLGIHPFQECKTPIKACMLAQDFQTHVKDIIEPKLMEWAPTGAFRRLERNQQGALTKAILKNGSILDLKSHDQDLKVFEGSDYDYLWCDEPPPEPAFKALFRGLTDRGGTATITGTPITQPWIHDLYQKAKLDKTNMYWAEFVDTADNVINIGEGNSELGEKRIREFADLLDPEEREARIKGRFLHLQGLIFKAWDRNLHLIKPFDWPADWPIWISIDPHPRKPWAVSWIGMTPSGNKILLRSDLVDGVCEDVAEFILHAREEIQLDRDTKPKIVKTIIDNYANVESMVKRQTTITDELNSYLYPTIPRAVSGPKNVKQKIDIFKTWLKSTETKYGKRPTFFAFDGGANDRFVYEIEHYVWAKMRGRNYGEYKDAPEKTSDDILDSLMQVALILGQQTPGTDVPKTIRYTK